MPPLFYLKLSRLAPLAKYIQGRDNIGKKMGRPIIGDEPKDKRVSLRATETTVKKFDECSLRLKKSKTDLLEEMVDNLHCQVCKNGK